MPDDLQNAIQESLPENINDQSSESLAETIQSVEGEPQPSAPEATPSPKVEQEKPRPFHEHPDWIAFQKRKEREVQVERQRADKLEQKFLDLTAQITQAKGGEKAETHDLNLDDEQLRQKVFYDNLRKIAKEEAKKIADEYAGSIQKNQEETQMAVTSLIYERFREKHPDVVPDSHEEEQIAAKFRQGYTLEDAYQVVMGPKNQQKEIENAKKSVQERKAQQTQQKLQANLETPGVSSSAIQPQKRLSVREFIEQQMKT